MKTNRPSESINAFAPEMAKFTSEKALVWTFTPREVDRVCDLTLLFIFFKGNGRYPFNTVERKMKRRDKEEERCEVVSKQSVFLFAGGICFGEDRIPTFSPRIGRRSRAL